MTEHTQVLEVERLRVEGSNDWDIVDEVSFTVGEGEILGVVGESGCGKTTTALALLGHTREGTRITGGSVSLGGVDILKLSPAALRSVRGRLVSYVPQDPTSSLSPRQRVGNQVAEALLAHGRSRSDLSPTIIEELCDRVQLPTDRSFLRRYPFELSGGQQQRVAIAMALAAKPAVVVLDEPTTGLDVMTQARVLELVRELREDTKIAFVYVTHDLAVVDHLADRVLVMYAGRAVEWGDKDAVFLRSAHPYTRRLHDSVPRLAVRHRLVGIAGTAPPPGKRPAGCFYAPRCPIATDHCRSDFPALTAVAPGHLVRCWRASESMPSASSPRFKPVASASDSADALLSVSDCVASYKSSGQTVLHGVSLSVAEGECVAVVGQSGSGKTTRGRCVAGLHVPDGGTVLLSGARLAAAVTKRSQTERRTIQMIFQNPERSLNPSQTVEAIVSRPLKLFGIGDRHTRQGRMAEVLDRVRLPTRVLRRYPREMSGGEKQRVAIARALVARPSLLVCDEITSALDVSTQAAIVELLEDLRNDGLAMLFITHNLALVNSIAHRVLVVQDGEIRESGTTADVIGRPAHAYTRELLASAPDLRLAF
jgi:peptide/nickel transport system ATP-binding protein